MSYIWLMLNWFLCKTLKALLLRIIELTNNKKPAL